MCSINKVFKTCPKCGCLVIWCNGGDVIYDSAQFMATCPSCGYKDYEAKFQRDKGLDISFITEQQENSYQEIKNLEKRLEEILNILVDDKEIEKPKSKCFLKGFIDRLWG